MTEYRDSTLESDSNIRPTTDGVDSPAGRGIPDPVDLEPSATPGTASSVPPTRSKSS